jgi:glycine dehydrogenase subunit 1
MPVPYLPRTSRDEREMLETIGISSIDELFRAIPAELQQHRFVLPEPLSEPEIVHAVEAAGAANRRLCSFIGGGSYHHFIPAVVDAVCSRSEFYTSYTPYQPEVSQGTLQVIYEYQSMICALTGLEVANASLYDGASAVAEAALLAWRKTRRSKVLVARYLHPHYRQVLETYLSGVDVAIDELPASDGVTDPAGMEKILDEDTAAVVLPQPNFLGLLEPVPDLTRPARKCGALVIAVVNPITLGVLLPPVEYGADLAVGEGQPLGIPRWFGGPGLGFMAVRKDLMRSMPGRIVGRALDRNGKRGFVLTLQAREQHIRREKATSNICTNQGLCALAACVYLALMGPEGLRTVGRLNLEKSHRVFERLKRIPRVEPAFDQPFFNEFPIRVSAPVDELIRSAAEKGIGLGIDLGRYFPELEGCLSLCVTETATDEGISRLVRSLEKGLGET